MTDGLTATVCRNTHIAGGRGGLLTKAWGKGGGCTMDILLYSSSTGTMKR